MFDLGEAKISLELSSFALFQIVSPMLDIAQFDYLIFYFSVSPDHTCMLPICVRLAYHFRSQSQTC